MTTIGNGGKNTLHTGANYDPAHYDSSHARAQLQLQQCEGCKERGHFCKATTTDDDDRPACIFCADGEPCPYEAIERRSQTAQPGHFTTQVRGKLPVARSEPPAATQEASAGSGTAPRVKKHSRPKPEEHVDTKEPRLCICGCGEIAKSNASPYAKGHNPNSKKAAGGNAAPVRRGRPTTKNKTPRAVTARATSPPMAPRVNGNGHAAAPALRQENKTQISEWQIDQMWARLPLATKVELLFPTEAES